MLVSVLTVATPPDSAEVVTGFAVLAPEAVVERVEGTAEVSVAVVGIGITTGVVVVERIVLVETSEAVVVP